ncbi:T9SS type A sorting domain-containing protein [Puia sp. P3]|uniref:T9SS type A sorting domain-containing protein n=1 Tax=Puia sp. P3 TaxID=3423952 RepID=UPI003D677128
MGDSTYAMTGAGVYSVAVSNSNVQAVTLYSIQNTDTQDSLALIDLYNSTNGSNWRNNRNWATSAPVATWFGIRISFGRVKEISLSDNNLTGSLPPSLGSLPSLTSLNIGDKQLTGTIPASLGNLSNLKTLIIGGCSFSGSIPPSLGNLHALQLLSLTDDQLTGSIPPELGNLKNVFNIILSTNQLSDTIPAALGNCTSLQEIFLDNNRVSGTIPASLGRLTNLWNLQLHDNRLTGPIPDSICYIPLAHLGLSNNALIGSLPDSLGRMGTLFDIQLQNNNLSGAIKADFSNYAIDSLFVSGNRYNFSVLPIKFKSGLRARYAPQQAIPLTRVQRTLSVSAGGNPANSTFTLFRNGTLISTQTGDSAFSIAGLGNYNIIATNTDAPLLTLYSDTLKLGLVLPDSSIGMTQTVGGTATTDLTDGIFRVVSLTPTPGANALSGGVTTLESVDDTVTTYNGQPYVQRHYDITPAANAASAQATVTLYYSQSDFDAYNTYVTSHGLAMPLLPTNGTDNGNVRITQYHGSFTGSAAPANYSQGTESIIPFVAWDATDGWWTVSFPVAGFSGFFLSTMSGPLPLTLLNFTAVAQGGTNLLKWQTTDETGTSRFVVQRSGDGHSYTSVGTVAATDLPGVNGYSFTDAKPLTGDNFYRLQMIDLDGKFTYSPVVAVKSGPLAAGLAAWPNPARYLVSLRFGSVSGGYVVLVYDGVGRCMDRIEGTAVNGVNRLDIRLAGYAAGIYTVVIEDRDGRRTTKIKKE